jgi:hypothetical protein
MIMAVLLEMGILLLLLAFCVYFSFLTDEQGHTERATASSERSGMEMPLSFADSSSKGPKILGCRHLRGILQRGVAIIRLEYDIIWRPRGSLWQETGITGGTNH